MKKTVALILTILLAVSALTVSAAAQYDFSNIPHNTPLKHPNLMVIYMDDGVDIEKVPIEDMMTEKEMIDMMAKADPEMIPEDCTITPGQISFIESRRVFVDHETVEPLHVTFRVWGTSTRPVMVFYKADDSEEWTLLVCHKGTDMEVEFPAGGLYGIGAAW